MVSFSTLIVVLSAITISVAAPAPTDPVARVIQERGPYNFALGPDHPLARRSNTNYNQDYTTGGTVDYSPGTNKFSVTWNTQDDFVVGVGWNPGSTRYFIMLLLLFFCLLANFRIALLPIAVHLVSTADSVASRSMAGVPTPLLNTMSWRIQWALAKLAR